MALTPVDIHSKTFKRVAVGGYHRDQVDDFLDLVIQEFEKNLREITNLKDQLKLLEDQLVKYRNLEETLNHTLVTAQEAADQLRQNARREGELIIQEARVQAERIIEAGQSKARRLTDEYADLQRTGDLLRVQLRNLLQSHMDLLDRYLPENEAVDVALLAHSGLLGAIRMAAAGATGAAPAAGAAATPATAPGAAAAAATPATAPAAAADAADAAGATDGADAADATDDPEATGAEATGGAAPLPRFRYEGDGQ